MTYVAVVGGGDAPDADLAAAEEIGRRLAEAGAVVVCGGLTGVMEAACRGASSVGGLTVGLLPGDDRGAGNPHLSVALPLGLGEARNVLVVRSADAVIAVGGEHGTLSEIAFARKLGRPVVGLRTWTLVRPDGEHDAGLLVATSPAEAVDLALRRAVRGRGT